MTAPGRPTRSATRHAARRVSWWRRAEYVRDTHTVTPLDARSATTSTFDVPRLRLRFDHAADRFDEHAPSTASSPRHPLPRLPVRRRQLRRRREVHLILANPPFAGSLDYEVHKDLQRIVKTKKTELLFPACFSNCSSPAWRAAVIVPDGVLFGSSNGAQGPAQDAGRGPETRRRREAPRCLSARTQASPPPSCSSPRPTPAAPTASGSTTSTPTASLPR